MKPTLCGTAHGLSTNDESDGEMLGRFAASGDQQAFTEIVRRHGPMVLRLCRRLHGYDAHAAEDAAQQVFLTLASRARELSTRKCAAGWLYRTSWHVSSHGRRDLRARRSHEQAAAAARAGSTNGSNPESIPFAVVSEELQDALGRALATLPEAYRDALVLHHIVGYGVAEAAAILGEPIGTVAARLSRGRAMLRTVLDGWGVPVAAVAVSAWLEDSARAAAVARETGGAPVAVGGVSPAVTWLAGGEGCPPAAFTAIAEAASAHATVAGAAAVTAPLIFGLPRAAAAAIAIVGCVGAAASAPAVVRSETVREVANAFRETAKQVVPADEAPIPPPRSTEPSVRSAAVPEPSGAALLIALAGPTLLARRRRPRRARPADAVAQDASHLAADA